MALTLAFYIARHGRNQDKLNAWATRWTDSHVEALGNTIFKEASDV